MPVLLQNTLDAGTAGVEVTNTNSGGTNGDALAFTGTARTYNADAMHGTFSIDFDVATGVTCYGSWAWTADDEFVLQLYVKRRAAVSTTSPFWLLRAGSVSVLQLAFDSAAKLRVIDAQSGNQFTSVGAIPLDTWVRYDIAGRRGATAATGELHLDFYLGDSTTPIETGISRTDFDLGAADFTGCRFGAPAGTATTARQWRMDSPRAYIGGGLTYLAPFGVNTAPTLALTPPQTVAAGNVATATATAVDFDGTIASYSWTWDYPTTGAPALTGASTATVSFTPATPGLYVLRCTVTDDDGAPAAATTEIRVPASGAITTLPMDGTGVGSWTKAGGATTDGAALADALDTTYIEGPVATSTENSRRVRLAPSTGRSSGTITIRVAQDVAGTITCKVRLYEGATLRQEWAAVTLSTALTDRVLTLDTGTVAAITNWANLYIELAEVA